MSSSSHNPWSDTNACRTKRQLLRWIAIILSGVLLIFAIACIGRNATDSHSVNQNSQSVATGTPQLSVPLTPAANLAYDGWPLPPLAPGKWVAEDKQAARNLLDRLVEHVPSNLIETARTITRFRTLRLSFYPGAKLCEGLVPAVGSSDASIFSFIVLSDRTVKLLDGTVAPIHDLDADVPVMLNTKESAEAYLRFFSAAIFANGGNFRIIDASNDALWARDASEADKQKAEKYVRPLAVERLDDGRWKASATVQFGTALSSVVFYIDPNDDTTKIKMSDDVTLASNLPLRREEFNGPLRHEIGLYK
jgi:hypothetical protein